MKFLSAAIFISLLYSVSLSQEMSREQRLTDSREQKLSQIKDLNAQIAKLVDDLLLPTAEDVHGAEVSDLKVFRLNPRETYGWVAKPQGGGCYFSFTTGSHDYQQTAELELQGKYLSVGFAGADYGFMLDIGDRPINEIDEQTAEAKFLFEYVAPSDEPVARSEYAKLRGYDVNGFVYKNRFPAVVGHSYLLRAISYGDADTFVVFRVIRQDTDGSLIVYWRPLRSFDKPQLKRG